VQRPASASHRASRKAAQGAKRLVPKQRTRHSKCSDVWYSRRANKPRTMKHVSALGLAALVLVAINPGCQARAVSANEVAAAVRRNACPVGSTIDLSAKAAEDCRTPGSRTAQSGMLFSACLNESGYTVKCDVMRDVCKWGARTLTLDALECADSPRCPACWTVGPEGCQQPPTCGDCRKIDVATCTCVLDEPKDLVVARNIAEELRQLTNLEIGQQNFPDLLHDCVDPESKWCWNGLLASWTESLLKSTQELQAELSKDQGMLVVREFSDFRLLLVELAERKRILQSMLDMSRNPALRSPPKVAVFADTYAKLHGSMYSREAALQRYASSLGADSSPCGARPDAG
jgi:hypothetical protein